MNLSDKCALYLMRESHWGSFKIGISKHPKKRRDQVERQYNVGKVELIDSVWFETRSEAQHYENTFHKRYDHLRSYLQGGREWFDLSYDQADGFLEWMKCNREERAYHVRTVVSPCHLDIWDHLNHSIRVSVAIGICFLIGSFVAFRNQDWYKDKTPIHYGSPWSSGFFLGSAVSAFGLSLVNSIQHRRGWKSTSFQEDGKKLDPSIIPIFELDKMNLLTKEEIYYDETPDQIEPLSKQTKKDPFSLEYFFN